MLARPVLAALTAAALALGLAAPTLATPGRGAGHDAPRAELPAAAADRAREALAEVRALFDGDAPPAARAASVRPGREATLALRDLARLRGELSGAERQQADAYLARPSATKRSCTQRICVHYSPGNVSKDGGDPNRVSDYVDKVRRTVDGVHRDYRGAGYRAPKSDGSRGGDSRTDIYLRDIGGQGLYGYCTSEKQFSNSGPYDAWAYCVLDNDYRRFQFPSNTPLENMRVTAAHEYFHAVQFAYDAFEDGWFMEATATWAEDEIFDGIDDNLQFLPEGPLGRPRLPLDLFEQGGGHHYGDWIWFRYLTEQLSASDGGLPTLVRSMWRQADASAGGTDLYSMEAVESVLAARGLPFAETFARFADANRRPATTYDEGGSNNYPQAPLWRNRELTPAAPDADLTVDQLDHQASATVRFTPSGTGPGWRLRIDLDMANAAAGSVAILTQYGTAGPPSTSLIALDSSGAGGVEVPFDDTVSAVEVTLVNASTRTNCWTNTASPYSCLGTPRDDNLTQRISAQARQG